MGRDPGMLVEMGRTDLGLATLRRALAHDPNMAQATHTIARVHALLGDPERASEVLGPVPRDANDIVPYLLMKGRIALWTGRGPSPPRSRKPWRRRASRRSRGSGSRACCT